MEGTESKSPTKQEDESQTSLEETIEGYVDFQKCVEDILEEILEDENFNQMTAENYDKKKSYLRKNLNELSCMHTLLFDQHVHLMDEVSKNSPSDLDSSDSNSKREGLEHLSSAVKDDALKVKDTKTEKSHLDVNEAQVVELQKQVADLQLVIAESDLKIKTTEEELQKSRKSLLIAKGVIANQKGEPCSNIFQENQELKLKLDSKQKQLDLVHEYLTKRLGQLDQCVVSITTRDDKIKKLITKNDEYKSDISRLEEILKSKEDIWNNDVAKLKGQLKNQTKSFDDLKKQLNTSRAERNSISGKLETLEEQKCSQNKLIQELETRLNALQAENERIVSSFEDAEKLQNELTLKVVELEKEVERQKEVISVTTEEKIEAIKQLSFSVDHYMSKYKQLRQSYVANQTGCFGFLKGPDTQQ